MSVRIGVNPIGWSNDDMNELGGDISLETCLSQARSAGYVGIEMGHKLPRDPDRLREVLTAHDLELVSGWYSTNLLERDVDAEWAAIQDHAGLLAALGCSVIILAETTGAVHGDRAVPLMQSPTISSDDM
jgi:inosose dehydratase